MPRTAMRLAALFVALPLVLSASACDPDLTVQKVPGDAGPDVQHPPSTDSGAPANDASTQVGDGGTSDGGGDADTTTDAGPTGHVIDGTNDFAAGETFTTTSANYTAYVSWDAKSVYFGMTGDDIGLPASEKKWVLVYLGTGTGGTTQGIDYNDSGNAASQSPALPFSALYHVRLKTDLSYVNGQTWSGSAWTNATGLVPDCEMKAHFVECRVARSALGSPTKLDTHISMVKEVPAAEWTYAGVPSTSFTDGKDPNYTKYFEFNLDDTTTAPNTYALKP